GHAGIVTKTEQVGRSGPTRVFPLGFGREPIFVTGGKASRLTLALGERRAICGRVDKGDLFHRPIRVAWEVAGVPSQDGAEFALGHLILSEPEITSNRDWIFDSHEGASLYQDHVGQWNQFSFRWGGQGAGRVLGRSGDPAVTAELKQRDQDKENRPIICRAVHSQGPRGCPRRYLRFERSAPGRPASESKAPREIPRNRGPGRR